MKVLTCLLSDQHMPNLLSVRHFAPDQLVLIESPAMKARKVASHFLAALQCGGMEYQGRYHCQSVQDENDLQSVRESLLAARARFPDAEWIANTTGGTKPMSIATYEFFKVFGGRVVYIPQDRPAQILDLLGTVRETCDYRPSVEEFITGHGFRRLRSESAEENKVRSARARWELAREIAKVCPNATLIAFRDPEHDMRVAMDRGMRLGYPAARGDSRNLPVGELRGCDGDLRPCLQRMFQLRRENECLVGKLEKWAVRFLLGGWLEVFFWGLLNQLQDDLAIWDIQLNCEISHREHKKLQNEFDIAFMRDFGLHVLECKSGHQLRDRDVNAMYKIEAITRQFRALRVRSYLVTTGENVFEKVAGGGRRLKREIEDRAAIFNCRILTGDEIKKLAWAAAQPKVQSTAISEILFQDPPARK